MSNVIPFKRRDGQTQFLLLCSAALFPDSGGFPAPFWIETWDGCRETKTTVVWRSGSYRAMRRAALELVRDGDRLIDFVAQPDLMSNADPSLLGAEPATAFALKDGAVLR
jgi:hypothetical protein